MRRGNFRELFFQFFEVLDNPPAGVCWRRFQVCAVQRWRLPVVQNLIQQIPPARKQPEQLGR